MGTEVSQRTRSRFFLHQAPDQGELRIDDPVLEVDGSHMENAAQSPLPDQLSGIRQGGHTAIVEGDHGLARRGLRCRSHPLGFCDRIGQRLFTDDVFSGIQRGNGDLLVGTPRGAHVDDVDVVTGDHRSPVRFRRLPSIFGGSRRDGLLIAATDDTHIDVDPEVEDAAHGAPGVRVHRPHEGVPDHADTQRRTAHQQPPSVESGAAHAAIRIRPCIPVILEVPLPPVNRFSVFDAA